MRIIFCITTFIFFVASTALAEGLELNCHVHGQGVQNGIKVSDYTADKTVFLIDMDAYDAEDKAFNFNNCIWNDEGVLCVKETRAVVKQFSSFLYSRRTGGVWYLNLIIVNQKSTGNSWIGNCGSASSHHR